MTATQNYSSSKLCVIPDTCTIVKCYKNGRLRALAKTIRRSNMNVIITDVVMRELVKVLRTTRVKVTATLSKYFRKVQFVKTATVFPSGEESIMAINSLENKFYDLHAGDSAILATAVATSSFLITEDRKLRRTADLYGVQAFNTKTFMRLN